MRVSPAAAFGTLLSAVVLTQIAPVAIAQSPASPQPAARSVAAYKSDFASGKAGEQWSNPLITKSPNGKRSFLGVFGAESVTLSLDNLPEHARIRLSADLLILLSWDGDSNLPTIAPTGPDVLNITVDHGPRLLHASFGIRQPPESITQSFPGTFPYDHVPLSTGAVEQASLGYVWPGTNALWDNVYHVERTFAHTGKSLKITFTGLNLQEVTDEAWGLDHVKVDVLPAAEPLPLDAKKFAASWTALGEQDPAPAVAAIAALVDMGDAAVKEIRQRSRPPATQADRAETIRKLIVELNADVYESRERASSALQDLGPAIAPSLRTALQQSGISLEVRTRIERLLADFDTHATDAAADRRARRLVEVFELMGTAEARKSLADLAGRAAGFVAFEAQAAALRLDGKSPIPTKLELPPGLPASPPLQPPPPTPPIPPRGWDDLGGIDVFY